MKPFTRMVFLALTTLSLACGTEGSGSGNTSLLSHITYDSSIFYADFKGRIFAQDFTLRDMPDLKREFVAPRKMNSRERDYTSAQFCEVQTDMPYKDAEGTWEHTIKMSGKVAELLEPGLHQVGSDLQIIHRLDFTGRGPNRRRTATAIGGMIEVKENTHDKANAENPKLVEGGVLGIVFSVDFPEGDHVEGSLRTNPGKPEVDSPSASGGC